jgi:hypothetical protein
MSDAPFSGGKNKSSQFDPGGVIKNVHDLHAQALRTLDSLSIVSGYWSHFNVSYDVQNRPINVSYFRGVSPNKVSAQCFADVSGSLQNKYFYVFSGFDNQKHHIWFNVDSLGSNPAPANSIGIEVSISSNDPAIIVAKAVQLTINNLFNSKFVASVVGNVVTIQNQAYGQFNPGIDVNTGFVITSEIGTNEVVTEITIAYDIDGNPIYQGQVLKNYYYDIYSGKFVRSAAVDVENLTVDVDLDGFSPLTPDSVMITGSENGTATGQKFGVVYNKKQQVLDSHDRVANFIYADFGTKDQRITSIEYTSATFPGIIIKREFTYTLVSGRYRRDSETWDEV